MDSDGFPERGWGSWRQWRDRITKLDKEGRPRGLVLHVVCRCCVGLPSACPETRPAHTAWANLHATPSLSQHETTPQEVVAMVAAR